MKKIIILALAVMLIACAFGCKKSDTPTAKVAGVPNNSIATVDGINITKQEYQTLLHNSYGKQALRELCEQKILEAWAKEEGVTPTKEQIDKEIQKLKDDGQYEDVVEQLGEDALISMIKDQLYQTNISKKLFAPSEEDLKQAFKYFEDEYKHGPRKLAFIVIGQDKKSLEEIYTKVESITDAAATEKKVKEAVKEYDSEKQPRAATLWIGDEKSGAPEAIVKAVKDLKIGDKSKVSELKDLGPAMYYFVVIKKEEGAVDKKLEEVKDELIDKVAIMNTMTKPDFKEALQKRKEKAQINIKIQKFEDVAEMITQPVPDFGPAPAPAPEPKEAPKK